jgi:hypothetical protein
MMRLASVIGKKLFRFSAMQNVDNDAVDGSSTGT